MASLSNHKDGRRTIYTSGPGRPKIALGRMPKKQAEAILRHVEALEAAAIDGSAPPKATAEWLAALHAPKLRARLEKLGLCEARDAGRDATLGHLIDRYRAEEAYSSLKPGTVEGHNVAIASIETIWGLGKRVSALTRDDAIEFRKALIDQGLAEATIRKRCAIASLFLNYAIGIQVIDRNPFKDARIARSAVRTDYYRPVTAKEAFAILEQLPSTEWKLLFALSRWGGLRVGSEPRLLRWGDINREKGVMWVSSPKTEHHKGRDGRWVPIFDEIEPLISARFHEAEAGDVLVLPFLVGRTDASLRKPLIAAIKRAGITPWRRLWHNMRKTRQNELANANEIGIKKACGILGNSPAVADRHYIEHTKEDAITAGELMRAQNRAQKAAENSASESQPGTGPTPIPFGVLSDSTGCDSSQLERQPRQDSNLE